MIRSDARCSGKRPILPSSWPGTTATAAIYRGGRHPARVRIPTGVWLSEIMPAADDSSNGRTYFDRFMARWPDLPALAAARSTRSAALARARLLRPPAIFTPGPRRWSTATVGSFPTRPRHCGPCRGSAATPRRQSPRSPSVGQEAAIDGNVGRVIARLYAVREPVAGVDPRLAALAAALVPQERAGDFAQALMDLGATTCMAAPDRAASSVRGELAAPPAASGLMEEFPARAERPERPLRHGRRILAHSGRRLVLPPRRAEQRPAGRPRSARLLRAQNRRPVAQRTAPGLSARAGNSSIKPEAAGAAQQVATDRGRSAVGAACTSSRRDPSVPGRNHGPLLRHQRRGRAPQARVRHRPNGSRTAVERAMTRPTLPSIAASCGPKIAAIAAAV